MRSQENKGRNLKVDLLCKDRQKHVKYVDFPEACLKVLGAYSSRHPLISLGADQNQFQRQAKNQNMLTE